MRNILIKRKHFDSQHIRDRLLLNMKFFFVSKGFATSEFNIVKFRRANMLKDNEICHFNDHLNIKLISIFPEN